MKGDKGHRKTEMSRELTRIDFPTWPQRLFLNHSYCPGSRALRNKITQPHGDGWEAESREL